MDVGETEASSDDPAVVEELSDLSRPGVRADVEVLRAPAEEEVPHAAAHQVGLEPVTVQTHHDLERVRVDVLPRETMLGPGDDEGFFFFHVLELGFGGGLTFLLHYEDSCEVRATRWRKTTLRKKSICSCIRVRTMDGLGMSSEIFHRIKDIS